jgi:hypothetical protein
VPTLTLSQRVSAWIRRPRREALVEGLEDGGTFWPGADVKRRGEARVLPHRDVLDLNGTAQRQQLHRGRSRSSEIEE